MDFNTKLHNYSNLVVRYGLNVVPGQVVIINTESYHLDLVKQITKNAYQAGAKHVEVNIVDPEIERIRIDYSKEEYLNYVPKHIKTKLDEYIEEEIAFCSISGSMNPEVMNGVDVEKLQIIRVAGYEVSKAYREQAINQEKVQWSIAAAPTPAWAKQVFPKLSEKDAISALWEQIFKICRGDKEDYLKLWEEHDQKLKKRSEWLNSLKIEQLVFTGPETNLSVGLSKKYQFIGGRSKSARGKWFEPNIPTEECFSTPDFTKTSGKVRVTRDFRINSILIKDLQLEFQDGEITSFSASSGKEAFAKFIESDAGSKRLGEVALVGIDSPIFQSGLFFDKVLYDENAACHIAIGSAYKKCIVGGSDLNDEELKTVGVNESMVHQDMMISDPSVSVTAITQSGEQILLLESGSWLDPS